MKKETNSFYYKTMEYNESIENIKQGIREAIATHPNTNVAKSALEVEEKPTIGNIIIFLQNLAEHTEFSVDFRFPLNYYASIFESMLKTCNFNEAALFLKMCSVIYGKRVDYVFDLLQERIEALLSTADECLKRKTNEDKLPVKRKKRKIVSETAGTDVFEVEYLTKTIKKLAIDKIYAPLSHQSFGKKGLLHMDEECSHPFLWRNSVFAEVENKSDFDSKKNYKIFVNYIEQKHQTLVHNTDFKSLFQTSLSNQLDLTFATSSENQSIEIPEALASLTSTVLGQESSKQISLSGMDSGIGTDSLEISASQQTVEGGSERLEADASQTTQKTSSTCDKESSTGVNSIEEEDRSDVDSIQESCHSSNDEGICLSDLEQRTSSPVSVSIAAEAVPTKSNILLENAESSGHVVGKTSTLGCNQSTRREIILNLLKIPEKILRKRKLMELPKDIRDLRPSKCARSSCTSPKPRRIFKAHLKDILIETISLSGQSDFHGFLTGNEEGSQDLTGFPELLDDDDDIRRLSFDSGIIDMSTPLKKSQPINEKGAVEATTKQLNCSEGVQTSCSSNAPQDIVSEENEFLQKQGRQDESLNAVLLAPKPSYCLYKEVNAELPEFENEDNLKKKVQDWHSYLRPILEQAPLRHNFNIFNIGTDIIETFSDESSKQVSFKEIMDGRDPTFASRYLLTTLILINQGNLSVTENRKSSELPTDWCDLKLQLLSTERKQISTEDRIDRWETDKKEEKQKAATTKQQQQKLPIADLVNVNKVKPLHREYNTHRNSVDRDSGISSLKSDS